MPKKIGKCRDQLLLLLLILKYLREHYAGRGFKWYSMSVRKLSVEMVQVSTPCSSVYLLLNYDEEGGYRYLVRGPGALPEMTPLNPNDYGLVENLITKFDAALALGGF